MLLPVLCQLHKLQLFVPIRRYCDNLVFIDVPISTCKCKISAPLVTVSNEHYMCKLPTDEEFLLLLPLVVKINSCGSIPTTPTYICVPFVGYKASMMSFPRDTCYAVILLQPPVFCTMPNDTKMHSLGLQILYSHKRLLRATCYHWKDYICNLPAVPPKYWPPFAHNWSNY